MKVELRQKKPLLKIGATDRDAKIRVDEQDGTSQPVDLVIKKFIPLHSGIYHFMIG